MKLSIPLIGQAYKHRSLELAAQTLKNWFPEVNPDAKDVVSLQPWPGLKPLAQGMGEVDAGLHTFNGTLYKITDNVLQRIDQNGDSTGVGTIDGEGLSSIISNDEIMVIVRDGNVYGYDGTTLTLADDPDFESPRFVAYLNSQAIYTGQDSRFAVSSALDQLDINGLDYARAESEGDPLIATYAHNQQVYMFGSKTIEPWYNSGVGSPPFERIEGGIVKRGTLSGHSIASNQRFIYFLGDDSVVYRMLGSQIEPVSTIPLSQQIKTYETAGESIGHCFTWDSQQFYYLQFPGEATWCFSESANGWFELTTGVLENAYKATSYAEAYGKQLFAIGGGVFELDADTYENGTDTVIRERISYPITAALLGKQYEGLPLQMNSLELLVKTIGNLSGKGARPKVMLSYSDDYGRNWSTERQLDSGPAGTYTWRLRTQQLGQFHERLIRIRVSDAVVSSIFGCNADMELCIG